jgi:hypothetical protein
VIAESVFKVDKLEVHTVGGFARRVRHFEMTTIYLHNTWRAHNVFFHISMSDSPAS